MRKWEYAEFSKWVKENGGPREVKNKIHMLRLINASLWIYAVKTSFDLIRERMEK